MDRRVFTGMAVAGGVGLILTSARAAGLEARVTGDVSKKVSDLDRRVYGQNLEHMGRQFQGGIIAEPGGRAPTFGNGFRADVRDALAELGVTHLRWPGGCFADAYHWRDGIGEDRPGYMNPMWGKPHIRAAFVLLGEKETPSGSYLDNRFGSREFMDYARALGAEPSLTASMEAREPTEAAEWVSWVRDEYGAGAVPVWYVGNEQWNLIEHNDCARRPGRYVKRYHQWAEAMRGEDPMIKLAASGASELDRPDWNRTLLEGIGREMDYFSLHEYTPFDFAAGAGPDDEAAYLATAASFRLVETGIERLIESMEGVLGGTIPISFDEWNVLASARNFLSPHTALREAVGAAGIIHVIHRHANHIRLADQFAPVNAAAPAIVTGPDGMARTPMYHVLQMYSRTSLPNLAAVTVYSPTFASKKLGRTPPYPDTPYVDASLTTADGRVALFLINRHPRQEIEVELEIEGVRPGTAAVMETVSGPSSFRSRNLIGAPEEVAVVSAERSWPGRVTLPCCSVTVLST